MGMMLKTSQPLGLLAINVSPTIEMIRNRIVIAITAPSAIVYFSIIHDTPNAGTSLTPVISVVSLNLPIPIRTLMDV